MLILILNQSIFDLHLVISGLHKERVDVRCLDKEQRMSTLDVNAHRTHCSQTAIGSTRPDLDVV